MSIFIQADKRVGVLLLVQVAQSVVDTAMAGLVGPDIQDQILHRAMTLGHIPVRHGNVGHLEFGVGPLGEVSFVELVDTARIRVHGFLLEVAYEAVANSGADEVGEEYGVL